MSPIVVTLLGIVTLVRPVQAQNAPLPIVVTLPGIIVFLQPLINVFVCVSMIALQFSRLSYTAFPFSTVMLVRPVQCQNASSPIVVTLLGIVTLVRRGNH